MDCDELKALLAACADGELAPMERETVQSHVAECGRCRQDLENQRRVQHVLDAVEIPPVESGRWNAVAKVLRRELEGKVAPVELKTRPRVEGLDESPAEPAAPEREPGSEAAAPRPVPAVLTMPRGRPRPRRPRAWWVAHAVGALAAAAILVVGLSTFFAPAGGPPIEPASIARRADVEIHGIDVVDPDYSVIYSAGDANDVAVIWVVPTASQG